MIVDDKVLVELKSVERLLSLHYKQVLTYLNERCTTARRQTPRSPWAPRELLITHWTQPLFEIAPDLSPLLDNGFPASL